MLNGDPISCAVSFMRDVKEPTVVLMRVTTVVLSKYVWLYVIYVCPVGLMCYSMAAPIQCVYYVLNIQRLSRFLDMCAM